MREHLQAVAEQTGIMPDELDNPEPSLAVFYLLGFFNQLSLSRQSGMVLNPITYGEIAAWQKLYRTQLAMWEIDVIKRLDMIYLTVQNSE